MNVKMYLEMYKNHHLTKVLSFSLSISLFITLSLSHTHTQTHTHSLGLHLRVSYLKCNHTRAPPNKEDVWPDFSKSALIEVKDEEPEPKPEEKKEG